MNHELNRELNCEQVFQHLTSVHPAPLNGELDRHLAGCSSCREMADLFQPAVALLESGRCDEVSGDAPRPWEQVWEAVSVAQRAADQLRDHSAPSRRRVSSRTAALVRSAALILAGVLVGAALGRVGAFGRSPDLARSDRDQWTNPLMENAADCRCEGLVTFLRDAVAHGTCPTCEQPIASRKQPALTLCMACHRESIGTRPDPASSHESLSWPRGNKNDSAKERGPFSFADPKQLPGAREQASAS